MKDRPLPKEVTPSNQFVDMLAKHRRGFALDKASTKLREALIASRDTGAKSTVTMTVTLTPGTDDQMSIGIQVTAKLPDEKLPNGMFWVDDDGNLCVSDPKQKELQFREVVAVGARTTEPEAKEA